MVKKAFFNFIDIGSWNIHGLFDNINGNKICKIYEPEFMTILEKFDILCLQETHCGPKDVRLLSISGYKMKHFNRPISGNHRYFGGMLLLYKDYLTKGISTVDNKHHDKLWIKLNKHFFSLKQDILYS